MAKTRKPAAKSGSTKKAAGAKKTTGAKKKKAAPRKRSSQPVKELDLRPLKRQLKAHVDILSRSRSADKRVQGALASLRRLQAELNDECIPTMTIPLA